MIHSVDDFFLDYYNFPSLQQVDEFYHSLKILSSDVEVYLHIVLPPKYADNDLTYLKNKNVFVYHLVENGTEYNSLYTHLNWKPVFENIQFLSNNNLI